MRFKFKNKAYTIIDILEFKYLEHKLSFNLAGSGHIEFEEFVCVFTSFLQPPSEHELLEAFTSFDKNGDGFLTEEEVKGVLKKAKQPTTDRNVREMMKSVDSNGDGKINYKGMTSI